MRVVEQKRDNYGNLIQEWGVYELTTKTDISTTYPKKNVKKVLISSHFSLRSAERELDRLDQKSNQKQ